MKHKLSTLVCLFLPAFCLLVFAQTTNAQTAPSWDAYPVAAPRSKAAAEQSQPKNISRRHTVRVRSVLPKAGDAETQEEKRQAAAIKSPATKETTSTARVAQGSANGTDAATLSGNFFDYPCCDCNRILLDGIYHYPSAPLQLFSSTPNSTVTLTLGHGGPGQIVYAYNIEGPYTDTLTFDITTDSNGTGSRVVSFFIKGLQVGQSNLTSTVPSGVTNPPPAMEVFACNCPQPTPSP